MKKFSVTFVVEMDEDNNILSSFEANHEEDVHDLITNVMYDVDDVKIDNLALLSERLQKTREELSTTREKLYLKEQEIKDLLKRYELCD